MIIGILVLILLAILFPGLVRVVLTLAFLFVLLAGLQFMEGFEQAEKNRKAQAVTHDR